jgi:hypothetical protein
MAEQTYAGAYGKWGIARTYALIFGITYIGVALVEVIAQDSLKPVLEFTAIQNAVHWAVGILVLVSFFAGEAVAKLVARIVGVVFVGLTLWGVFARASLGDFLGFGHPLPWSYNVVHALTAVVALYAGFASRATYRASTAPA